MINVANNFETDFEIEKIIDTCIEMIKIDEQNELADGAQDAI